MLGTVEREKLFNIGKGMTDEERELILKAFPMQLLVNEINRRNKIVEEQYYSLFNKLKDVKPDTPCDELSKILKECKNIFRIKDE